MPEKKSPRTYDSMVQAFHLIGKHEEAIEAQKMAIHFLGDDDGSLKEKMNERLAQYTRAAEENGLREAAGTRVESQ